ncbi:toll/interleukin-1 receptor domain-containing protein [Vibrio campbellii]|uniref:toll/interleukin-1 receptor domain-containing protein n=1 Tax=Vibrio campbellii TaxID=680 RepID=UPI00069466FF|nr:toll/interleukin-1 receptor domain-containing protein [Vibrio campbellii]
MMEYLFPTLLLMVTLGSIYVFFNARRKSKDSESTLRDDGFNFIFSGRGSNFIAFSPSTGRFRFGNLVKGTYVERSINTITNYEWKWVERNAQKISNKFFFYISDVEYSMHEVFYNEEARMAEVEWAKLQAVISECMSISSEKVRTMERLEQYDFFVSHASEDKPAFVRPLVNELNKLGLKIWYDEFTLEMGDSLRRSIDSGLGNAKYGVVVLSPAFFSKQWPQYELDALVNRSMLGGKVILPIWHGVDHEQVSRFSHSLADKVALSSAHHEVEEIASQLLRIIQKEQ